LEISRVALDRNGAVRARDLVDQRPGTEAAAAQGYFRAAFYLVSASFGKLGMQGCSTSGGVAGGRSSWRRRSWSSFVRSAAPGSGAQVAEVVAEELGVRLHRRTVERVRAG
jgi:hypothetical protein